METHARYVLIGGFTLAGFAGLLAFVLWFARVELDRQFAYYDIDFPSVSGLGDASDVRFVGLPVGQVVDLRLSPADDGRVRVRIEVDAETPVRTDSLATIEAQGVTGVAFVGISAGSPGAPRLADASDQAVPVIAAGQSVLQSLSDDAPELLEETLAAVRDLRGMLGPENRDRVAAILTNIERSSAAFATWLDDLSAVTATASDVARQIDRFGDALDTLTQDASGFVAAAETTLGSIDGLATDARAAIRGGTEGVAQIEAAAVSARRYIDETLSPTTGRFGDGAARIDALAGQMDTLIDVYATAGRSATQRLDEAEGALAAIDGAARRLGETVETGATPLIADLRAATAGAARVLDRIDASVDGDVAAILDEVGEAATAARRGIDEVGANLTAASERLDGLSRVAEATLGDAGDALSAARQTLGAMDTALETGGRTLSAAERAFDGAGRLLDDEAPGLAEGLRGTLDRLDAVIDAVAGDIPEISGQLRAASRSAELAFAEVASAAGQTGPSLRAFGDDALPQYARLAAESRALVANLDALIDQVRRDPGRFFLSPRAPEYRR